MPSMPKAIEHTIQNHVAMITMNNPPANTWTADSLHALKALVCTLNQNKDVYAWSLLAVVTSFSRQVRISICLLMVTKHAR